MGGTLLIVVCLVSFLIVFVACFFSFMCFICVCVVVCAWNKQYQRQKTSPDGGDVFSFVASLLCFWYGFSLLAWCRSLYLVCFVFCFLFMMRSFNPMAESNRHLLFGSSPYYMHSQGHHRLQSLDQYRLRVSWCSCASSAARISMTCSSECYKHIQLCPRLSTYHTLQTPQSPWSNRIDPCQNRNGLYKSESRIPPTPASALELKLTGLCREQK